MSNICVIDDKEILRDSLSASLTCEDHTVVAFGDPAEALQEIPKGRFDLVITDLKMPGMDGITLIRGIRDAGCDVPVIMMTAFATVTTAVEAMQLGAVDYVAKPFEADVMIAAVERALENARLRAENEALRASIADFRSHRTLVGSGAAMARLRTQLDRVAASHATVLVTGESGTGKELAAQYVHAASPRSQRPMLCVNCAALSATLLESELFGHERGAFTGADRTRKGRFELAHGGTLLLDEISEMAMPLQAKLLRVLQEGEFERVGSSTTRRADVRIIATTNRNLATWAEQKKFRSDLYYRLNVLPVTMPALKDRREDIPELVKHFLNGVATPEGGSPPSITPEALQLLTGYHWPGNVRELENICRRAATLCTGETIGPDLVRPWISAPNPGGLVSFGPLREGRMLEDAEKQLIKGTLGRFNGHRAKSAKALGMGVRTLGMKLKQYRDEGEEFAQRLYARR